MKLGLEFTKNIPEKLDEDTLYVSMDFATVVHKCCCGCGHEVVTPLSPSDWKLTFDGETISLWPSIGNWSFACQSHYWIEGSEVQWDKHWSREKVEAERARDTLSKHPADEVESSKASIEMQTEIKRNPVEQTKEIGLHKSIWQKLKIRIHDLFS